MKEEFSCLLYPWYIPEDLSYNISFKGDCIREIYSLLKVDDNLSETFTAILIKLENMYPCYGVELGIRNIWHPYIDIRVKIKNYSELLNFGELGRVGIPSRVTNNFDYRNNNIFNFLDLLNKDIHKKLRLQTYMS